MLRARSFASFIGSLFGLFLIIGGLFVPLVVFAQATPQTPSAPGASPPGTTTPSPASEPVQPTENTPRPFRPIVPNPSVPIPGVTFTPASQEDGLISIPYLAQYISGIYRLSVGLGAILAAVMIVFGGFKYMLAASAPEVTDGKTIIIDAVVGLVVLLTSFLILKTINPKLVEMNPIRVQYVQEIAIRTDEFTGNPAHTGFDNLSQGTTGTCGSVGGAGGGTQTLEGMQFHMLTLRGRYIQGSAPWGNISYGRNLTENQSNNPCTRGPDGRQHANVNGCWQTMSNGGCGPTAFAEIMAYYGIQATNAGDAALAQNVKLWNGNQLVPMAQHPSGQRIATALQARVGSHLYDPIDAARRAVERGSAGTNGNAMTNGTRFMAIEGFRKQDFHDPVRAAQLIRSGHPVVLYCHHCNLKFHHIADPDHRGGAHFMVLHGVSQDGRWFKIHDGGGGGRSGGAFISADEIQNGRQPARPSERSVILTSIVPNGATVRPCNTSSDGGRTTPVSNAGDIGQSATVGEVTRVGFPYQPPSGDAGWDSQNPSQLLFPQRFSTAFSSGSRPRVHLYIFIHGLNSHGVSVAAAVADRNSWISSMQRALNEVGGSKNIVVAAPYYTNGSGRSYMNRFEISGFYQAAVAAMTANIPGFRENDIEDVVVGGHSAATCQGPNSPVLRQSLIPTLGGKRMIGVVAYDGCMSDSNFTASSFRTPPGVALLMNPDFASLSNGMGMASASGQPTVLARRRYELIRTQWELPRIACPAYVQNACAMGTAPVEPSAPGYNQRRCNACYGKTVDGKQIMSFETVYGHRESVFHMTRYAFRAFYGN